MKTSEKGIELIKMCEGLRLKAYQCSAEVWTIGYGHTGTVAGKPVCSGMTITKDQAEELLKQDLKKFERAVEGCNALTFKPNRNQFDALVSFTYNCGAGNLYTLVKDRDTAAVSEKFLLYNKANGKELEGLKRRRKLEKELFDTPVFTQRQFVRRIKKILGVKTKKGALSRTVTISISMNSSHDLVKPVQRYLKAQGYYKGKIDGHFGTQSEEAVKAYQRTELCYTMADGEITARQYTWKKLLNMI